MEAFSKTLRYQRKGSTDLTIIFIYFLLQKLIMHYFVEFAELEKLMLWSMYVLYVLAQSAVVNGSWSAWSSWTKSCSEACGLGKNFRWRYCDNPTPSINGFNCFGQPYQVKSCHMKRCSGFKLATTGFNCQQYCSDLGETTLHFSNFQLCLMFQIFHINVIVYLPGYHS